MPASKRVDGVQCLLPRDKRFLQGLVDKVVVPISWGFTMGGWGGVQGLLVIISVGGHATQTGKSSNSNENSNRVITIVLNWYPITIDVPEARMFILAKTSKSMSRK